jgi:hypothetical protein
MYTKKKIIYLIGILVLLASATGVVAYSLFEATAYWHVTPVQMDYDSKNVYCPPGSTHVKGFDGSMGGDTAQIIYESFIIDGYTVTVKITEEVDNSFRFDVDGGLMAMVYVKGNTYWMKYQYEPPLGWPATNTGPVIFDTGLHDGYVDGKENYQNVSHLDMCLIPKGDPLTATKTADTSYTRTYTWDITKDFDGDYDGFIGDAAFNHDYEVSVDQTIVESAFKVYGTITVNNSNDYAVQANVSDSVGGTAATLMCTNPITVPENGSATCDYYAFLGTKTNGTNTATITSLNPYVDGDTATADYIFGEPTVVDGYPTILVTDTNGQSWTANSDASWKYNKSFQCSDEQADYTNGVWTMKDFVNTASIDEIPTKYDSATVKLTCYAPVLDKDAYTNWEERYDWEISKEPDGTYEGFIGDAAFYHGYTVKVDLTKVPQNFKVYGEIDVTNPVGSPESMTVDLTDELVIGVFASVDCGDGATSVTVAPGATETCAYSGYLASKTDGTNTATGTFNGLSFVTTEPYAFGAATPVGFTTIKVTDDQYGDLGEVSDDKTFTYSGTFQCSANQSDYTNGVWTMKDFVNTASIDEIPTKYDSATVKLTCYAPVITKDASASYDERHIWDIDKTVDPTSQGGFAGDVLPWTWTVTLTEDYVEENFSVSGSIYVENPAGSPGDMTVSLVDKLNDGTVASVDCGEGATSVTVASGATETCSYTAVPTGRTATENKATGTFESINFVATAPVSFVKTVVNGTATVTDTEIGLKETLTAGLGDWTYTEDYSHTCSTNRADYFVDGVYTQMKWEIENWAYVKTGEFLHDSDDATTTYTCDASFVDIYKTTNGAPADPTKDIQFALYSGTTVLSTVSTFNNGASLQFPTALVPDDSYTICEAPVPAGYTFEISVDGGNVLTYAGPPGTELPTGEVQCFDFVAAASGTTLTFDIENSYPGGAPRTPGYWKNWSTCSGGNQQYTAAALGGVEAGVFLLDDLLPQTLGSFTVETCVVGVRILSAQDVVTGKNMASDAAYTLARALLAARLNQDAGACVPTSDMMDDYGFTSLEQVLTEADTLLSKYTFAGTGSVLSNKDKKVKEDYNYALSLAGIIDDYNNSEICIGEPSH